METSKFLNIFRQTGYGSILWNLNVCKRPREIYALCPNEFKTFGIS